MKEIEYRGYIIRRKVRIPEKLDGRWFRWVIIDDQKKQVGSTCWFQKKDSSEYAETCRKWVDRRVAEILAKKI